MRVGLVCPYSWEHPGGVQAHVRDLAETLIGLGHEPSVLAPGDDDADLPAYVVPAGRAVPVRYNGSVARVNFGLISASRVRRWLRDGDFDVLHVHEPAAPGLSLLALWVADGPAVATFHSSITRSRAMAAAYPILQPIVEKLSARIAVSEAARRTLVEHLGGDAVLIPNGVAVSRFASAEPLPGWPDPAGTLGFLGRFDESRKGFAVLRDALAPILSARPGTRVLVAGPGNAEEALEGVPPAVRNQVAMLGMVSDEDKARMLRSVDVYVAPNTGGESFGIILTEAMAAGTPVLASDIDAFARVLDDGKAGALFPNGDSAALAAEAIALLDDSERRGRLAEAAREAVRQYDWETVAADVVAVYETVAGQRLDETNGDAKSTRGAGGAAARSARQDGAVRDSRWRRFGLPSLGDRRP
jgi:phosphatidylinositol alpha-mannosyltransferase